MNKDQLRENYLNLADNFTALFEKEKKRLITLSLLRLSVFFGGIIFNKCFEIEINGENIRFDYKLRDGVTRRMNAALLMKQMGIAG